MNWVDVRAPESDFSYTFYESPHVSKLDPSFGPVKATNDQVLTIHGSNFVCPDSSCKDVKVKFGEGPSAIFVPGEFVSESKLKCKVPAYTRPDVLRVEVTLNGIDYSNDGLTYGYYDPYVISASPRLIAVDGSTEVTLTGMGFVDSGEVKTLHSNHTSSLSCGGSCQKNAEFIDKNHIKT